MNFKSKKTWIIIILILISAAVFAAIKIPQKKKAVKVAAATAAEKNLSQTVSAAGNISPINKDEKSISSAQKVDIVYVKEGDMVKKGDNLLKFDTSDLEYQLKKAELAPALQSPSSQIDIDNLKKKIDDSYIKSDIYGKVIKVTAKSGEFAKPGISDAIYVYDLSSYKLIAQVSQYDAVNIKLGQNADIKVKGLNKTYTGSVTKIGNIAESVVTSGSQEYKVTIEITLKNPDSSLKPGYEADADIMLTQKQNVLAVNFESVLQDSSNKKYIFVVAADGTAKKRYVKTGLETDFDIEIVSGLSKGERYITNPPDTLKDGEMVDLGGK